MRIRTLLRRGSGPSAALAAALAILLILASVPALAQEGPPQTPSAFYGRVFQEVFDGRLAPDGLTVAVYVYGETEPRGETMLTANGWYGGPDGTDPRYIVPGTQVDVGKKLVFKVGDLTAKTYVNGTPDTVTFQLDQVLQVDLVIPDTTPPTLSRTGPASLTGLPYRAYDYTDDTAFAWAADEDLDANVTPAAKFSPEGVTEVVYGDVTFPDAGKVKVVPGTDLIPGTNYTLTLSGVKDLAGNVAVDQMVYFTTTATVELSSGSLAEPKTIRFCGGEVEVELPVGAVVYEGATLEVLPVTEVLTPPSGLAVGGQVVDISAPNISLPEGQKVTLRLKANAGAKSPRIYYYDFGQKKWVPVAGSTYDRQSGFVVAELDHFSIYGVLEVTETGPAPVVSSIQPSYVVAGKAGQVVTVTGQNFVDGAQIALSRDGQEAAVVEGVYESATELKFNVPQDLAYGFYEVTVRNPDGGASTEHVVLTIYAGEASKPSVYVGAQGTQVGTVSPGGAVRVEVPVTMGASLPRALVIIRVDDPVGRPLIAAIEGPVAANAIVKFSASFNLPNMAGTYGVKAFVWDGWTTMNPLAEAVDTSFTAE